MAFKQLSHAELLLNHGYGRGNANRLVLRQQCQQEVAHDHCDACAFGEVLIDVHVEVHGIDESAPAQSQHLIESC